MSARVIVILLLAFLAPASIGKAQEADPQPRTLDMRQAPPSFKLGVRVLSHRSTRMASPILVIASSPADYVEAISRWTPSTMFPVLIDDGSHRAAENIARFVHAFEPKQIVRLTGSDPMPAGHAQRKDHVERALGAIWDVESDDDLMPSLVSHWQFAVHSPIGVVIAAPTDPAWTGALALAAGHAQPIVWYQRSKIPEGISSELGVQKTADLIAAIQDGLDELALPWQGLGDVTDAITICMNIPVKCNIPLLREKENERFALTDILGKHRALTSPRGTRLQRWAWSGQLFGNEATAAYRAMSGLFLQPERTWVFDGYPNGEPWSAYDGTGTVANLTKANLPATLLDSPRQGVDTWRSSTTVPLDADIIFVNTKGMPEWFDLEPGRAHAADIPVLDRPAAVSYVHSWSAARPGDPNTIAGTWFDRGAFMYVGSVQEPYLQAFIPTPVFALRLVGGLPWAAACRPDGLSPVWKVAVLGDPLLAIGTERPKTDLVEFDDTLLLKDRIADAVNAGDFAEAVRTLVMLGHDEKAVELAAAVLIDRPDSFDVDLAETVAMAAFRVHNKDLLVACVLNMSPKRVGTTGAGDALWHAAESDIRTGVTSSMAAALERSLRGSSKVSGAIRLAGSAEIRLGVASRNAILERVASSLNNQSNARKVRAAKR